jgi:Mannosyltransferase (PIG-V)
MVSPARPIAIGRLVVLFAVWAACVLVWSWAAWELVPLSERFVWPAELAEKAPPLARWDAGWYRTIVEQGYGPAPPPRVFSEHAFFPLYPAAVFVVSRTAGADPFFSAIAVSAAALLAAAFLFAGEGLRRTSAAATMHAALFLLLFPTAFFFVAAYSESLFLLLSLAAFRQAARRRLATAVIAGALAGLTRPSAVALALPLALAWWAAAAESRSRSGRRPVEVAKALAVGAAPAVAVLGWILGLGLARGEPGLFFRVESVWERGMGLPVAATGGSRSPSFLLDAASLALFALIALHQARRRRWSDAAWTAGAILLPVSTGTLMSLSRYLVVVYPAFFALSEVFERRPRLRLLWWVVSAALLAAAVAAFVHWRWVA